MKAFLVVLIALCAFADDDFFSRYDHGKTIQNRLKKIEVENHKNEKKLLALEGRERKILNTLSILYNDMKIAVDRDDRIEVENTVEKLQKSLTKIRKQKRFVLRNMREIADKVASPYRDELVRDTRIEHRIGYEVNSHVRAEIIRNQKALTKEIEKLAHKYATMASKIASQKLSDKINKKAKKGESGKHTDILKAKDNFKKASKHAYAKYYKKIVNTIEEATAEGVEKKDIKFVCRTAIEHIINKLQHQYLTIVKSAGKVSKVTKKNIKKPMRGSMKQLGKKFDKKMIKKTDKAKTQKISKKEVKKALKDKKK
ncbi:Axoneme-associated protein mst101 [Entamoeba marina]